MKLAGVRRQLTEARDSLVASAESAARGDGGDPACYDPAYRHALRSRNLIFHAARGLAAALGEPPPEMPVVGGHPGTLADHAAVQSAIDAALAVEDDLTMVPILDGARVPLSRYLGWLRGEVGRLMKPA